MRKRLPPTDILKSLYVDQGVAIEAIAARYGVAPSTVYVACHRAGLSRPRPWASNLPPSDEAFIAAYVSARRSVSRVAEIFKCSPSAVERRRVRLGHP